jgi:glutamyl-tRNA reductase|tara:strand:+ start:24385 stop:25668 length:1284 start_codon:yes stop_codon:yes gene_type:complete
LIGLISINYKTAPLEIREKFYFDSTEKNNFHKTLLKEYSLEGLMILSTCNRTEIYFEFENHTGEEKIIFHGIMKSLVEFKKYNEGLSPYILKKNGSEEVSKHLFRLISGLESMIIGEFQIVEQIKEAYYFAKDNKMIGPILNRMVQKSLETGKFIRSNTFIGKGAVSVSYAAVEHITKKFDLKDSKILCIGAGETSKLSIKHLVKKKINKIFISNRTEKKSKKLAKTYDLNLIPFNKWKEKIIDVDVIIFSTSSKKPLIKSSELNVITKKMKSKKILLVDLSVPRNLSPNISKLKGIELINIDDLKDNVNENYNKRKSEVTRAENYIDEFLLEFNNWTNSRQLRPSILSIKKEIQNLIHNAAKHKNNNGELCSCHGVKLIKCKNFNNQIHKIYDKFSDNLVKKIKLASNNGKDEKAIDIINKIFIDD